MSSKLLCYFSYEDEPGRRSVAKGYQLGWPIKGGAMLKLFSFCLASIYGTSSATACVGIERSGLQHLIVNYCQYPIVAHYVSSSGETGATDSIPPGGSELTPIPTRYSLNLQWCKYNDWEAAHCKLPTE
jgi:hypothetical protein